MSFIPIARAARGLVLLAALASGAAGLHAQAVWTGTGGNTSWSNDGNWQDVIAPGNDGTESVIFSGTSNLSSTVDTAWSVSGISFSADAGAFALSGSALTLGSSGITSATTSSITISNALALGSSATTFSAATNGTLNLNGAISGSGRLMISGGGTVNLGSTSNSFTGGLTVTNTTLQVSGATSGLNGRLGANPGSATAGFLTFDGGTLWVTNAPANTLNANKGIQLNAGGGTIKISNGSATLTYNGIIAGTGNLSLLNNSNLGTLSLGGANTYTGTTNFGGGSLTLTHASALQNSTLAYTSIGPLNFSGITSATFGGLSGSSGIALANTSSAAVALSVGSNNASTTYSGVLSGSGSLAKSGAGNLTLTGASTHSGGTTISAGALVLGVTNALPTTGALTLAGGQLSANGFSNTLGTLTLSATSTIDFSGGTSTLSFGSSSAQTWSGTLSITNYSSGTSTLRFGTDNTGLTAGQLAQISFGGAPAQIDSLGYVTAAIPEPSTYAALAGVAVLGLAWYRRRQRALRA